MKVLVQQYEISFLVKKEQQSMNDKGNDIRLLYKKKEEGKLTPKEEKRLNKHTSNVKKNSAIIGGAAGAGILAGHGLYKMMRD